MVVVIMIVVAIRCSCSVETLVHQNRAANGGDDNMALFWADRIWRCIQGLSWLKRSEDLLVALRRTARLRGITEGGT
jgi:hypothetical protein